MEILDLCVVSKELLRKNINEITKQRRIERKLFRIENDLRVTKIQEEYKNKPFILKRWE